MRLYGVRHASLGVASPIPARDFLNAMERGNALHWVMEHYFQRYPESSLALSQPVTVIEELCKQAIALQTFTRAFHRCRTKSSRTAGDGLACHEVKRKPFRVVETENSDTLWNLAICFSICELTVWMRWTAPWCSSTTKQDASQLLLPWANPRARRSCRVTL